MKTELLDTKKHKRENFYCEEPALVDYLKTRANKEQKEQLSACFVTTDEQFNIVGYYTLSNDKIALEDIPEKYKKSVPKGYGVPVTLIGRIARDTTQKGKSTGRLLLMDALKRALKASKEVGSLAVVLDSKNPKVETIYSSYGFIRLDNGKMFLPMKVIALLP